MIFIHFNYILDICFYHFKVHKSQAPKDSPENSLDVKHLNICV